MKWYSGPNNRSATVRKYKTGHYYNTDTTPWYEIFVERKWTGKVYKNEWKVELVKDKHTKVTSLKVYNFKDVSKAVVILKRYAELYHIATIKNKKRK